MSAGIWEALEVRVLFFTTTVILLHGLSAGANAWAAAAGLAASILLEHQARARFFSTASVSAGHYSVLSTYGLLEVFLLLCMLAETSPLRAAGIYTAVFIGEAGLALGPLLLARSTRTGRKRRREAEKP